MNKLVFTMLVGLLVADSGIAAERSADLIAKSPPPLEPTGEVSLPHNAAFVAACHTRIDPIREHLRYTLGNSQLSLNQTWGVIWRVDFTIAGDLEHDPWINRIVCTEKDGEWTISIAIGQSIPPLDAKTR